jgi:hypothetical protein
MKIVAARNRMHHEPFDEDGFLEIISENAPKIMDSLRTALKDIRFLVPSHVKSVEGQMILTAEDTCNSDAHFRSVDLEVSLPLEAFPSGKLIAWRKTPESCIALGSLLTAKMITQQSRDFGIFDRMEKSQPQFTFLRSD